MSLCYRHTLSLVFAVPASGAPVRVDNPEVKGGFQTPFQGSNTGTFGEALPTRTTLDAHAGGSNVVQPAEPLPTRTRLDAYTESSNFVQRGEARATRTTVDIDSQSSNTIPRWQPRYEG